ncbi:MAG: sigma-70 family RNA polymerase sigma factor [Saprospiraceae bacterium]|nr:sigma-70 family RNA polymerase sigma factor [Saprospiraceae bacterium]
MSFQQNSPYIDTLVLTALRNNDESALNYLFTNYYNRLFRTGLKYGATSDAVQEAIQAVFIDVWQYRQTLGDIVSFEAYLKGALRKRLSKMANVTKKPNSSLTFTEGVENDILLSVEAYESVLILQETNESKRQALIQALEQLTPRQKELIVLRYFEEMPYADIAQRTQLQTDSIYKTIHEALKRLRVILSD